MVLCNIIPSNYFADWIKKFSPAFGKGWQKRYFCLLEQDGVLVYWATYPKYIDHQPKGSINLVSIISIQLNGGLGLILSTLHRDYLLKFRSPEIKDRWYHHLLHMMNECRNRYAYCHFEEQRRHFTSHLKKFLVPRHSFKLFFEKLCKRYNFVVSPSSGMGPTTDQIESKIQILQTLGIYNQLQSACSIQDNTCNSIRNYSSSHWITADTLKDYLLIYLIGVHQSTSLSPILYTQEYTDCLSHLNTTQHFIYFIIKRQLCNYLVQVIIFKQHHYQQFVCLNLSESVYKIYNYYLLNHSFIDILSHSIFLLLQYLTCNAMNKPLQKIRHIQCVCLYYIIIKICWMCLNGSCYTRCLLPDCVLSFMSLIHFSNTSPSSLTCSFTYMSAKNASYFKKILLKHYKIQDQIKQASLFFNIQDILNQFSYYQYIFLFNQHTYSVLHHVLTSNNFNKKREKKLQQYSFEENHTTSTYEEKKLLCSKNMSTEIKSSFNPLNYLTIPQYNTVDLFLNHILTGHISISFGLTGYMSSYLGVIILQQNQFIKDITTSFTHNHFYEKLPKGYCLDTLHLFRLKISSLPFSVKAHRNVFNTTDLEPIELISLRKCYKISSIYQYRKGFQWTCKELVKSKRQLCSFIKTSRFIRFTARTEKEANVFRECMIRSSVTNN